MSKTFKFIITLFLSIIVLAACNTAEEATTETDSETGTAHTEGKEVNDSVETDEPTTQDAQQEESTAAEENSHSITFTSNGTSKTEELTSISSEQYTLQVIPGFSFTQEEPGKDVLYYDENDSVYMRIEAMTKNDTTLDDLAANTEEVMNAVSKDYEQYDITSFVENQNLTNSKAYIAKVDTEEVIAVVFEKDDKIVRLTIFDNEETDLSEAMIKMGLTIE